MAKRTHRQASLVGQAIDGFVLLKELGEGAASRVYQAIEPARDSRLVALKVLDPVEQALNAAAGEQENPFAVQQRLMKGCHEPGLIRIYRTGTTADGCYFLAMECAAGMTLEAELFHRRLIPWAEATEVMDSLAWAVSALHEAGIVHRDLKPANVMVSVGKDGRLKTKLIDYGSIKQRESWDRVEVAKGQIPVGTPLYMAPEQARGFGTTTQSDVYALAAIYYELLIGKPVLSLKQTSPEHYLAYLRSGHSLPPLPLDAFGSVHPRVAAFVHRCLSRDPGARPADAFAFGHELNAVADEVEVANADADRPMTRLKQTLTSWIKRKDAGDAVD